MSHSKYLNCAEFSELACDALYLAEFREEYDPILLERLEVLAREEAKKWRGVDALPRDVLVMFQQVINVLNNEAPLRLESRQNMLDTAYRIENIMQYMFWDRDPPAVIKVSANPRNSGS